MRNQFIKINLLPLLDLFKIKGVLLLGGALLLSAYTVAAPALRLESAAYASDLGNSITEVAVQRFGNDPFLVRGVLRFVPGQKRGGLFSVVLHQNEDQSYSGKGSLRVNYGTPENLTTCSFPFNLEFLPDDALGAFFMKATYPSNVPHSIIGEDCPSNLSMSEYALENPFFKQTLKMIKSPLGQVPLPDGMREGKEFEITLNELNAGTHITNVGLILKIDHPRLRDIVVELTSPSGKVISGRIKEEDSLENSSYLVSFLAREFESDKLLGTWKVKVRDSVSGKKGVILEVLLAVYSYEKRR